jgi:glycosyltransferase involved in cell wall biosynthesis
MKTIGLCMIVKNEAEIILRSLESARPIVNYVLIEDTGSTDGTQKVIREWLDRVGLPGEVYDEPWQDFAYNRSHALARLRKNQDVDFALILDADDVLELPAGFTMPDLKADSYTLEIRHQRLRHWRPHLVRNALPWRYEGVLHEFLSCPVGPTNRRTFPEEHSQQRLRGVRIRVGEEGARRQSNERYWHDAALLESALATEADPFLISRYTFYLAQSYRDCGEREKALANYLKRAELGYWDQEVFISLYQAANLKADLGYDADDVLATYSRAHNVRKDRTEALHAAARYCRVKERFEHGYKFARRALGMKAPRDALFLERWVYDYGVLDEYAVNAYWIGKFDDCQRACKRLLRERKIPNEMRERIEQNARFAREKLSSPRVDTKNKGPMRIGLCMIVKNESKVIVRCLESVRRILDYVLIEDTGSTDGTQKVIREWLDRVGLPGEVYDEPWQDFAYNRSHALTRLREKPDIDYALIMDADDVLVLDKGFDPVLFKEGLSQDLYHVRIQHGPISHSRPQICNNRREFRYRGVLHEFMEDATGTSSSGTATGFHIRIALEGARSADPDKYRKDAALLEKALQTEQDPFLRSRYTFYLAQSYRDAGEKERALDNYLKRAELGYWVDEVFMSLFGAAQLKQALGHPHSEVIAVYERATEAAPHRAEALHGASRLCREANKFAEGFEYARRGLQIVLPSGGLFVQNWIHDYGLLDEFAVNAYWAERYQESLDACERLLADGKMPTNMNDRVKKNAEFARDKLALRVPPMPEVPTIGRSQAIEKEPTPARLKLVLVCGPWGSGTTAIAGMLERLGALGVGPYFETADPNTPNSYESIPFRETIRYALGYPSEQTFSFAAGALDAVQCGLRVLQSRIEQQEFGPYDLHFPKPIFLKYPLSALVISQICEVFDTKLIYVMRSLEDIERTRLRRNWPAYYGAEGASMIYSHMSAALKNRENQTMTIDYKQLLASPVIHARDIAEFAGLEPSAKELRRATDFVEKPAALSLVSTETRRDEALESTSGDDLELAFVSLYHVADALRTKGRPFDEVIAAYDRASSAAPHRADALYDASRLYRLNNRFAEGYEYAKRGLAIPPPNGGPSLQQWIYDYGLLDEFAVNAYWIERYDDCLSACERLLQEGKIPHHMRERIENNARFARQNLRRKENGKTAHDSEADEVFMSLYNTAGRLRAEGQAFDEVIAAYDRASSAAPHRAEALHDASRLCRWNKKFAEGYEYAKKGLAISPPNDGLSLQQWIYDYGLLDELSVNAYWTERYTECRDACQRLLREGKMPQGMHDRVKMNADFAANKLRDAQINVSSGSTVVLEVDRSNGSVDRVINESGQFVVRTIPASPDRSWILVVPYVRNNFHSSALQELVEGVYHGLKQLDQQVSLTNGDAALSKNTILIGAHRLSPQECSKVPNEAVVYNSEHVDSHWLSEDYIALLRRTTVWDYNADNARRLEVKLGRSVLHVSVGYVPQFTRVRAHESVDEDIDVLFFGSSNPRRQHILDDLRRRGLRVHHAFGVYGEERDALLQRAKVVLNIHYYLPGALEILRIAYLLSNNKAVVCELNPGESLDSDLEGAFITAPYDSIADKTADLVADPLLRSTLANAGYRKFICRSQATILREALGERLNDTRNLFGARAETVSCEQTQHLQREYSYKDAITRE